jgi:adenylate cyclase
LVARIRSLLRIKDLHDKVQSQSAQLKEQTEQLSNWNRLLEERVATQLAEIQRIGRLERFLAPQVAQMIASSETPDSMLASHRREVTVLFCDLRGFTAFNETSEPEEVMAVLREYHESLGELIFSYEGTLDRFAGDGIMIVFNDPVPCDDHTQRAVRLALDMRERVDKLAAQWRRQGHDIGFERRREYTAVGSVTNLASRLCDEARSGQIVIAQRAFSAVEPLVEAAPVGELNLKGFSRPVPAYEILRWRDRPAPQKSSSKSSSGRRAKT